MKTLREIRKKRGITITKAAKEIDISSPLLTMYELGDRYPGRRNARNVARWYGVTLEQVLYGEH